MRSRLCVALVVSVAGLGAPGAWAPEASAQALVQPPQAAECRATLDKLMKTVSVDLHDARLEDVMTFIANTSGATIDPMWLEGAATDGLQKDHMVTVKVDGVTLLTLMELVLEKAQAGAYSQNTWQFGPGGVLQAGPKSRLNAYRYLKVYDINDLLYDIPSFTDYPQLDLDSVLNQRQGGGSGSIFQQTNQNNDATRNPQQRAQDVMSIITTSIDPDQWRDNGGDAASVREYNGALLVTAPDYIQRQIDGYPFWPETEPAAAAPGAPKRDIAHYPAGGAPKRTDVAKSQPTTPPAKP